MKDTGSFDDFYHASRERVLTQAYALTGDLNASRAACRDAFVAAWHHWRKVDRLDDREAWVRTRAWQQAQRRHSAHPWHKERGTGADVAKALEALSELPTTQRKALILDRLAGVGVTPMAREVGLPVDDAQQALEGALTDFAVRSDVPPSGVDRALAPLGAAAEATHFPRVTIIRRAGSTRRRAHTLGGAVIAVAALVVSGVVVTDAAGLRPTLDGQDPPSATNAAVGPAPADLLPDSSLLSAAQLDQSLDAGAWSVQRTHDNSAGNGKVLPCLGGGQQRYLDPKSRATLVRQFAPTKGKAKDNAKDNAKGSGQAGAASPLFTQYAEVSASDEAAVAAFERATESIAGCADDRAQLITTKQVPKVGEQALLFALRDWDSPVVTNVIGIARTGAVVTVVNHRIPGEQVPDVAPVVRSLGTAVSGLCTLDGGGACAPAKPAARGRSPLPVGKPAALLSVVDLPPVTGVDKPWFAVGPESANDNVAATRCDQTSFTGTFEGARFSNSRLQSYLILNTKLPVLFGLTETVGALPEKQAESLVSTVRDKLSGCSRRDLGTDVSNDFTLDEGPRQLSVWTLTTELPGGRTFDSQMAIMRVGTSMAQLGFVPVDGVDMADGAFTALAQRALARLEQLKSPRSGKTPGQSTPGAGTKTP